MRMASISQMTHEPGLNKLLDARLMLGFGELLCDV